MAERFKLTPAVYLLLRRGDQEVLLLRRANTGYQDGKYSLIAGHMEGNETAMTAVAREAQEEAGIRVKPTDLKFVHLVHRLNRNQPGQERLDVLFEARQWQGDIANAEPEKCDDLSWFSLNDLPASMLPLIRHVLRDVAQGAAYSEYLEEPV